MHRVPHVRKRGIDSNGRIELVLAGNVIHALSIGGIETCFEIPAFDVCLDIGRCPPGAERRGTLLLTHAHIDHAAGLPYYVSIRGMLKHTPPRVFCPKSAHPHLAQILEAWAKLQADTDQCTLTAVEPGDTVTLGGDGYARAFRSPHRIDCIGWTLYRRVRKLRPELVGLPSEAIAQRAQAGEDVHVHIERAEIAFPGDTMIDVVEREASVREARVLLLECTFMESKVSVQKARAGGHVHLDEIAARADLFQNEVILLTHFSRRYRAREIEEAVNARLPKSLKDRVRLLIHADDP
jgi:ribonuclease Z